MPSFYANICLIQKRSAFYNIEVNAFLTKFIYYLTSNKEYVMNDNWIKLFKYILYQLYI